LLGDGDKGIEKVYGKEKNILFQADAIRRAAKAEHKSLVPARQAQRTNQGMSPFVWTLWVSIHFKQSEGATPLWSLWSQLSGFSLPPLSIFFFPLQFLIFPSPIPRKAFLNQTTAPSHIDVPFFQLNSLYEK
jgi:hypothetical protein